MYYTVLCLCVIYRLKTGFFGFFLTVFGFRFFQEPPQPTNQNLLNLTMTNQNQLPREQILGA